MVIAMHINEIQTFWVNGIPYVCHEIASLFTDLMNIKAIEGLGTLEWNCVHIKYKKPHKNKRFRDDLIKTNL